jgi:hypothetical protein
MTNTALLGGTGFQSATLAFQPTFPTRSYHYFEDGQLDCSLALAARLLASVHEFALQFDLGEIDLPPIVGSQADQARLRSVAPLYLASELEAAGLLSAVETMAGLYVTGGLAADLGPAASCLIDFWQGRHQRFTVQERHAFFAHLFGDEAGPVLTGVQDASGSARGGDRNREFVDLMINLAEALYKLYPTLNLNISPVSGITLQTAAQEIAANLSARAGGVTAYAGQDLMRTVNHALAILKDPAVQHAFGSVGVWGVVETLSRNYLRTNPDIATHLTRGKAGMLVLAWLAEIAPRLDDSQAFLLASNDSVIAAATAWLQSSLDFAEKQAASATHRS